MSAIGRVTAVRERARRVLGRRRFRRSLRADDVLIVGYPRSGTTWLAYMLANAIKPDAREELSLKTFGRYVPDVNDAYFWAKPSPPELAALPSPRFLRVHAAYDPSFPRVVYVLRDPRDTLVSHYHFLRLSRPGFGLSLAEFVARDEEHWPVDWSEHVTGWLRVPHPARLVVRYEELHERPEPVLEHVLAFAGLSAPPDRVAAAVDESRFDHMQRAEDRGSIWERKDGEREVRRGEIGGWRDELDEESAGVIARRYGAAMAEAGYG